MSDVNPPAAAAPADTTAHDHATHGRVPGEREFWRHTSTFERSLGAMRRNGRVQVPEDMADAYPEEAEAAVVAVFRERYDEGQNPGDLLAGQHFRDGQERLPRQEREEQEARARLEAAEGARPCVSRPAKPATALPAALGSLALTLPLLPGLVPLGQALVGLEWGTALGMTGAGLAGSLLGCGALWLAQLDDDHDGLLLFWHIVPLALAAFVPSLLFPGEAILRVGLGVLQLAFLMIVWLYGCSLGPALRKWRGDVVAWELSEARIARCHREVARCRSEVQGTEARLEGHRDQVALRDGEALAAPKAVRMLRGAATAGLQAGAQANAADRFSRTTAGPSRRQASPVGPSGS